ncbi:hypothetical protein M409DRAFT_27244 [Zasmidium cellare ATCC 36951]|uniref:HMG box domain-containing protein n=1 Tax=Zasmidium cellare ATCC 36951 TaxID=1080233 RepID=A0A6A6C9A8_ZASCE|nr:uncharacterized protein M409DRAFT_27244 [Zasmidium cellare ATCC 36951]KAF2162239.1 hypothetical protein M409DRAFT_27244 [Zasmidium cellare ATCC 36951]
MTSTAIVQQGPSPEEDYGLDAIAKHNAATSTEQFPSYQEDTKGLGIYQDEYAPVYQDEQSYIHNPPTPRSNTASDGIRTRSGRSTRRTDSPFSTSKSRVSKSPAPPRSKREKKSKVDKSKLPKLTAPLSVLTKDMAIPVKDIGAWVNRSVEDRMKEKEKNNGYITRPMNSFMLYRSAYSERTKAWCSQNNHQIVSSVSGESWPMEPDEIRNQFDEWAKIERQHHQEAHPNYKFSPSKSTNKRRKEEMSEDGGEPSDLDGDPDGEYRGGRNVRQRRHDRNEAAYLPSTVGFDSHPYYGHQGLTGYEQSHYQYANPGRPLPSNVAFDHNGLPYNPQTNTYLQTSMRPHQHQQPQYPTYLHDMPAARVSPPGSLNGGGGAGQQTLGGYGLPGGQGNPSEDLFSTSRTSTPMQHYAQYPHQQQPQQQPIYPSYAPHPQYQSYTPLPGTQQYEHAQYLQQQSQPQAAIDPSLEAAMAASVASGGGLPESHFDEALGDFGVGGMREFYEGAGVAQSPVDVNATLAPTWAPGEELG